MKNDYGITLVALVITIIVIMILATVGISMGTNQYDKMQLKGFYTKLEIAQQGIEKIVETNESYVDSNNNTIYLKDLGAVPTAEQSNLIESLGDYTSVDFKFFTAEQVEKNLEISGVELDLLINFKDKLVIAPQGIEVDGKFYYMLEDKKYSVPINEEKNKGNVDFDCTVKKYTSDSYKITVTPKNIGDIKEGIVKYKKSDIDNYWTVANNNEIITNQLITYDIIYIDANNNSKEKKILLSLDNEGNPIITETNE